MKPTLLLPFGFLLLALVAGLWLSQPPADEEAKKKGIRLTGDKLQELLEGLGYDVTPTKDAQGRLTCTFPLTIDSWEFKATVELATDNSVVWLSTGLQKLPEGPPPVEILLRLLKENEKDTKFFSVGQTSGIIKLSQPVPNYEVTPAVLRRNLEAFKRRIAQTEDLWNPKKWPKAEGK